MGRRHRLAAPRRSLLTGRRRFLGGSLAIAASLPALGRAGFAQGNGRVNVYNWDTYIGETTIADFAEATGIEVRYDLYASNDELFAKLREGNPGYDVIVPTNDYVERMITADMLLPLDHGKIPNAGNLEPVFADPPHDPGRAHTMPYFWGTIGLGYRISAGSPTGMKAIFESDDYAGRIAFLADKSALEVTLKYLGYSLNTLDPAQIEEATQLLIETKPKIRAFAPDTGQDLLISGEVDICVEWNGDILQVMEEDDDLSFVVPEEGGELWEDAMCIPRGGPNPENAHAFINFILEPEVHAAIAQEINYALPNAAAKALLPQEMLDNPAIYPSDEVVKRCEISVYKGEDGESLYEEALTRVLAA